MNRTMNKRGLIIILGAAALFTTVLLTYLLDSQVLQELNKTDPASSSMCPTP
ncbi:hypothetical protein Vsou_24300 [Vulcanisaeta souniana JCM 11219]|uniref:Uncharacterized protein n=1 Tax=Vulcanisaeta souniana JCM 11219 TaxID=1293586 RepID=A0ABN6SY05_9CREN|nr:hypothetical protein Vsou_24300 [Vulcanisaeta souniana JCM 11219]